MMFLRNAEKALAVYNYDLILFFGIIIIVGKTTVLTNSKNKSNTH